MSPIIDFYPTNFRIDLNGKKWAWQGVALLPFVDEDRLRKALSQVYSDLTPDEGEWVWPLIKVFFVVIFTCSYFHMFMYAVCLFVQWSAIVLV